MQPTAAISPSLNFLTALPTLTTRVEVSANLWPVGIDGAVDAAAQLADQSRATRARLVCTLHGEADAAEPLGSLDWHAAPCDIVSLGPVE